MSANLRKEKSKREASSDLGLQLEEYIMAKFEPDILLSEQYDRIYHNSPFSPEKELMLAILEEAVSDVQRYSGARDRKGKKHFEEVDAWFLADDGEGIFSFENICEVLGFDPDYLCRGLLRWKQGKQARNKSNNFKLQQRLKNSFARVAA